MKNTKSVMPMFSFYDRTEIQNYLEKKAEEGWLLEKMGAFSWRFRRIAPKKLRYSVVYFPAADLYDAAPGEREQTFREYCEHAGWHFAASQAQMQIFYNESLSPVPIETDPVIEVENIHKSVKKSMLPSYWLLLVSSVLQIISQGIILFSDAITYFSNNIYLYFMIFWPSLLLLCIWRLATYYRWHRLAKQAAEEGKFLESHGIHKIEIAWAAITFSGLIAVSLFGRSQITMACVLFGVVMGFAIIAVELLLRKILKKKGYAAKKNKRIVLVTLFVTVAVMLVLETFLVIGVLRIFPNRDKDALPLNLSDLVELEEDSYKTLVIEDSESILLGYLHVMQYSPDWLRDGMEMEYHVVHVKADFLYERCFTETVESGRSFQMTEMDPSLWNAEAAWILDDAVGYRLRYEDYIVSIYPEWPMTEDQMAAVGRIFG